MKNCPICHRKYSDQVQYCTRDGTRLQDIATFRYCPECSVPYPANIQKCPAHNLELIVRAKPAGPDINHCILCNKYYPPGTESCPVHGIALKGSNSAVTFEPKPAEIPGGEPENNNVAPVEYVEPAKEAENVEAEFVEAEFVEAEDEPHAVLDAPSSPDLDATPLQAQVVESPFELPPVAHTRELEPPRALTMNTLTQYSEYASADRKLVGILAVVITILIVGLGAYSLSRPSKQARTLSNPASPAPGQAAPAEDQVASADEEEGEIIQHIELNPPQPIPAQPLQSKPADQHKGSQPVSPVSPGTMGARSDTHSEFKESAKIGVQKELKSEQAGMRPNAGMRSTDRAAVDRTSVARAPRAPLPDPLPHTSGHNADLDLGASTADHSYHPSLPSPAGGVAAGRPEEPSGPHAPEPEPPRVESTVKPRIEPHAEPRVGPPASDDSLEARPKLSRHRAPRVVATVANKLRVQTPNGYIYQFDLILHEVTGLNVRWRSVTARKISYSGRSAPVHSLIEEQVEPNSTARYRIVVKMTGTCIEDWYGQLVTTSSGIDENDNPIELEHTLLLDDSFPIYSGGMYRRMRSFWRERLSLNGPSYRYRHDYGLSVLLRKELYRLLR